jgi:hypothetical protein
VRHLYTFIESFALSIRIKITFRMVKYPKIDLEFVLLAPLFSVVDLSNLVVGLSFVLPLLVVIVGLLFGVVVVEVMSGGVGLLLLETTLVIVP